MPAEVSLGRYTFPSGTRRFGKLFHAKEIASCQSFRTAILAQAP